MTTRGARSSPQHGVTARMPSAAFNAWETTKHSLPSSQSSGRAFATAMAQGVEESAERAAKRRRTEAPRRHRLRHVQQTPNHIEPAPQDTLFVQSQLLRSIGTALAAVGFDSVRPSALEAFRADTEECKPLPSTLLLPIRCSFMNIDMLHFLTNVRESMLSARRTQPIPQDFSIALAASNIAPSFLKPHLELDISSSISAPTIPAPAPAEPDPPKLSSMLGNDLVGKTEITHAYIPSHFPSLPSRHAWQSTPVFTERERDARKIRERATQEGMLAEQALRRLTSANKPRTRGEKTVLERTREQLWQDTLADVLGEEGGEIDPTADLALDNFGDEKSKQDQAKVAESVELLRSGGGMVVNHDRNHWRRSAPLRSVRM